MTDDIRKHWGTTVSATPAPTEGADAATGEPEPEEGASAAALRMLIESVLRSPALWEAVRTLIQAKRAPISPAGPPEGRSGSALEVRFESGDAEAVTARAETRSAGRPAEDPSAATAQGGGGVWPGGAGPDETCGDEPSPSESARPPGLIPSGCEPIKRGATRGAEELVAVKDEPEAAGRAKRVDAAWTDARDGKPGVGDWLSVVARMSEGHLASLKAATELLRAQNESVAELRAELERLRAGVRTLGWRTDQEARRLQARVAGIYNQ